MIKIGDVLRFRKGSHMIPTGYLDSVGVVTEFHNWEGCDYIGVRVQRIDMSHRTLYTVKEDLI